MIWQELLSKYFSSSDIQRESFLVGDINSRGEFYCKACGSMTKESRSTHFATHMKEYKKYLKEREEKRKKERIAKLNEVRKLKQSSKLIKENTTSMAAEKSPNYDKPCATCGGPIARTGKRGKPPKLCTNCKSA